MITFLQELLDNGRAPSTLKVYVAAGQSIGRNDLIKFLKGARRLNPPPQMVLLLDLSTVLRALRGPLF